MHNAIRDAVITNDNMLLTAKDKVSFQFPFSGVLFCNDHDSAVSSINIENRLYFVKKFWKKTHWIQIHHSLSRRLDKKVMMHQHVPQDGYSPVQRQ